MRSAGVPPHVGGDPYAEILAEWQDFRQRPPGLYSGAPLWRVFHGAANLRGGAMGE